MLFRSVPVPDVADTEKGRFDGALEVGDGAVRVSAETSRRLTGDASVVVVRHDPGGTVLDVGRKTRTIPPAIRRALLARDTGCRFPGCSARRCDAHHVAHWADGGATSLDNLVLLCRRHHRAVHEGGFTTRRHPDGAATFYSPDGKRLEGSPALPQWDRGSDVHGGDVPASVPALAHALDSVTERLAMAGITIGARTVAVWDGTPFDLAWAVDVLRDRPGSDGDVRRPRSRLIAVSRYFEGVPEPACRCVLARLAPVGAPATWALGPRSPSPNCAASTPLPCGRSSRRRAGARRQ